jgi:selenide,water dikinase
MAFTPIKIEDTTSDMFYIWMFNSGAWVWKLKDHIDRKFMDKFGKDLPDMDKANKTQSDKLQAKLDAVGRPDALNSLGKLSMRCGGCGSKVGATVLSNVMKTLTPFTRPEVLMGIDSPDDCAMLCDPCCHANKNDKVGGPVTLQTVDYFRSFLDDPYLFGQVAANHSLR